MEKLYKTNKRPGPNKRPGWKNLENHRNPRSKFEAIQAFKNIHANKFHINEQITLEVSQIREKQI